MTERTPIAPEMPEVEAQELPKRPPGRPRGTDYRRHDAAQHERMRQLLADGVVHCRTAAARLVVGMAHGHGCEDSKVRRLVRRFLY
jgi:hypothetical protein